MGRISNGWEIVKESWKGINADKEILVFPIFSFAIIALISIPFFFLILLGALTGQYINEVLGGISIYAFWIIYLILVYFIAVFFEAAIISSATIRLHGKSPTFSDGIKTPLKKLFPLFTWAITSLIVNGLLKALKGDGRGKSTGMQIGTRAAAAILGIAWALLTLFVIPVMLFEHLSLFSSIKRSKDLFIKTWGESVTAQFSTSIIFGLLILPSIILLLLSWLSGSIILIVIMLIIFLICLAIISVLSTSINGILKAGLYYYATTGKIPRTYKKETFERMFVKK